MLSRVTTKKYSWARKAFGRAGATRSTAPCCNGWRTRASPGWPGTIAEQPARIELDIGGKKVLLVHSTPWEPRGAYVYPHSPQFARFGEAEADFVLYGHTHRQVVRRIGGLLVVNPGSTGEARDHNNDRQLSCAVLDTVSEEVVVTNFEDPLRVKNMSAIM